MDKWYGNGDRRKAVVTMADTIYRAGSGDVSVLPEITKLAVDRSHGSLIRASAAEFAGQLIMKSRGTDGSRGSGGTDGSRGSGGTDGSRGSGGTDGSRGSGGTDGSRGLDGSRGFDPAIVNALIGAAADPEAIVRITAVRTLGLLREPRLVPILAARLNDSARVVRISAAESLFDMGVIQLDAPAGSVLAHVQDEWADSLRTFNDDAADHVTLGWLEASRGRTGEGEQELRTATRLDPSNARAHVFLGVLAARAGRFDEALQRFKAAKAASPTYPNIDRLIDEAQKRR
jgi:hypothetical protein